MRAVLVGLELCGERRKILILKKNEEELWEGILYEKQYLQNIRFGTSANRELGISIGID